MPNKDKQISTLEHDLKITRSSLESAQVTIFDLKEGGQDDRQELKWRRGCMNNACKDCKVGFQESRGL